MPKNVILKRMPKPGSALLRLLVVQVLILHQLLNMIQMSLLISLIQLEMQQQIMYQLLMILILKHQDKLH